MGVDLSSRNNFKNSGFFAKVSIPVHIYNSLVHARNCICYVNIYNSLVSDCYLPPLDVTKLYKQPKPKLN